MRVVLLALQVREPMGQYVEALSQSLSLQAEVHLYVPEHYDRSTQNVCLHRFRTGASRARAMLRMLDPVPAFSVWRDVCRVQPDVVHLLNGEGSPWSLVWAHQARRAGTQFGVTVHDPEPHPFDLLEAVHERLARLVWRRAHWVHIHSVRFIPIMQRRGVPRSRIVVIPHGSVASRFLRHRTEGVLREPLALFFGRLTAYKGLETLVDAGLLLEGRLRIAIAGPGRLPRSVRQRIAAHQDLFELHLRHLPEPEVARLFQRASVLVMPYKHATQSSLPLISAAFGVPVIATAVGGLVDDVRRVGGVLVPPDDSERLARGMLKAVGTVPHYPTDLEFDHIAMAFMAQYRR